MKHLLLALTACVLVASTADAADEPKSVVLRWHGQSFFDLTTSKGKHIDFDHQAIEDLGRPTGVKAEIILMSNEHNDHTQVTAIENYQKVKVIHGLKQFGKKWEWNVIDEKFDGGHIRSVGVYHDTEQGLKRGKNTVFIVEVDGMRIVHLGDLGHLLTDEQVKAIGPVDVLMIPVGGVYTLNGDDAKKVVEQLKPSKYVFPMHYGVKGYDDLLPVDEFLEDQKKENVKRYELTNKLTIESDFKPKEPIIAVLNWK